VEREIVERKRSGERGYRNRSEREWSGKRGGAGQVKSGLSLRGVDIVVTGTQTCLKQTGLGKSVLVSLI